MWYCKAQQLLRFFFKQSTGFIEVSWNETRQRLSQKLLPCSCLFMNRNFISLWNPYIYQCGTCTTCDKNKLILADFQENFLLLLQLQSRPQIISIYENSSWNKAVLHKPHPFFGNILNKRLPVSCNVRTVQQNLLLLTRKQFHVIKTNTCALVQKQSDN